MQMFRCGLCLYFVFLCVSVYAEVTLFDIPLASTVNRSDIPVMTGPFQPNWESLKQYQCPDWFRDAKFGIFVHWGPETLRATGAFDRQTSLRKVGVAFVGDKFDAAHWAKLFRQSGARYVVQVAEHHDGYALYDSTYTSFSSVKMTPRRDFVAELSAAVRNEGLFYGLSSHTEEYWWFYANPPKKAPPAPLPDRPAAPQPDTVFLDGWLARLVDLVDKYHPQLFWFDWCIEQPGYEPYLQTFASHYYNCAAQWGQQVVINYKYFAFPGNTAVLDISPGTHPSRISWTPEGVHTVPWQFDTMANEDSWFWTPQMKMRPLSELLGELADVISKNGNLLLNFPPAPDGTFTPDQERVMIEIGRWLSVNGDAVYGTRPWCVFGEGPTQGLGPTFGFDVPKTPYTAEDIRFTVKGDSLYAMVLAWPGSGKVVIRSLAADTPHLKSDIREIRLLGTDAPLKWRQGVEGLLVELPPEKPCDYVYVLKITVCGQ